MVWWEAGAQPPQLLADKEVTIASGYNGRFFNAQVTEKQPFTIIWDGQLFELDGWVVPKGKLNADMKAYLKFATDTQRLADQASTSPMVRHVNRLHHWFPSMLIPAST